MNVVLFLFLIFLNQLIVSREFFHMLYLELVYILVTIFLITFFATNPNFVFVWLISLAFFIHEVLFMVFEENIIIFTI